MYSFDHPSLRGFHPYPHPYNLPPEDSPRIHVVSISHDNQSDHPPGQGGNQQGHQSFHPLANFHPMQAGTRRFDYQHMQQVIIPSANFHPIQVGTRRPDPNHHHGQQKRLHPLVSFNPNHAGIRPNFEHTQYWAFPSYDGGVPPARIPTDLGFPPETMPAVSLQHPSLLQPVINLNPSWSLINDPTHCGNISDPVIHIDLHPRDHGVHEVNHFGANIDPVSHPHPQPRDDRKFFEDMRMHALNRHIQGEVRDFSSPPTETYPQQYNERPTDGNFEEMITMRGLSRYNYPLIEILEVDHLPPDLVDAKLSPRRNRDSHRPCQIREEEMGRRELNPDKNPLIVSLEVHNLSPPLLPEDEEEARAYDLTFTKKQEIKLQARIEASTRTNKKEIRAEGRVYTLAPTTKNNNDKAEKEIKPEANAMLSLDKKKYTAVEDIKKPEAAMSSSPKEAKNEQSMEKRHARARAYALFSPDKSKKLVKTKAQDVIQAEAALFSTKETKNEQSMDERHLRARAYALSSSNQKKPSPGWKQNPHDQPRTSVGSRKTTVVLEARAPSIHPEIQGRTVSHDEECAWSPHGNVHSHKTAGHASKEIVSPYTSKTVHAPFHQAAQYMPEEEGALLPEAGCVPVPSVASVNQKKRAKTESGTRGPKTAQVTTTAPGKECRHHEDDKEKNRDQVHKAREPQARHPKPHPKSVVLKNQHSSNKEAIVKKTSPTKVKGKETFKTSRRSAQKEENWFIFLEELRAYKKANGDCIVRRGFSLNSRLDVWVAEQRKQYNNFQLGRRSTLTKERIEILNKLGFSWDASLAAWENNMKDLLEFKEQKGHVHVPWSKVGCTKLGLWVREQRKHYALLQRGEPSHMTPERVKQLDAAGFCWDAHEASWQEGYHGLIAYKQQYGNCLVPTDWPDNPKLAAFVNAQRRNLKRYMDGDRSTMTEKHIAALREIGFNWKLGSINRSSKATQQPPTPPQSTKKRKSGAFTY